MPYGKFFIKDPCEVCSRKASLGKMEEHLKNEY